MGRSNSRFSALPGELTRPYRVLIGEDLAGAALIATIGTEAGLRGQPLRLP